MKRFLPVMLALSFSAIAVALTLFVVRPRIQSIRVATGDLRDKVDEVIEEITEPKEGAR
jgi:hypothetical protein